MSVCTACGEPYRYNGRLHCSLEEAPIRETPEKPPRQTSSFLIHYHRPTGRMTYREYDDGHAAMGQRFADERTADADTEVVVLSAKDLATIQQTHSRYFMGDWGMR